MVRLPAGAKSAVEFESQAPTKDAEITVTGPKTVNLGAPGHGQPAQHGPHLHPGLPREAPQANQGYHVKLSTDTEGTGGNKKSKVFWVTCGDVTDPTDPARRRTRPTRHADRPDRPGHADRPDRPGHADRPDRPGHADRPDRPGHADRPDRPDRPGHADRPGYAVQLGLDLRRPDLCGVSVDYPANIPDGQANDVNIRVQTRPARRP